jgi:hypothetical protein
LFGKSPLFINCRHVQIQIDAEVKPWASNSDHIRCKSKLETHEKYHVQFNLIKSPTTYRIVLVRHVLACYYSQQNNEPIKREAAILF